MISEKKVIQPLLLAVLLVFPCALFAAKPVWEIGGGVGFYHAPHYLGADQSATYVVPIPYFVYRGEYFRSDSGGLMSRIYDSDRLKLRLSLGGSLPVPRGDNDAREGMPDLDLVLEVGPTLQYRIAREGDHALYLELPVRGALSVGGGGRYQGVLSNPRLNYRYDSDTWLVKASFGPEYASRTYHGYFYDVEPRYATVDRPAYRADGGYIGTRSSFSAGRRFGNLFTGGFVHYFHLGSAENEDSPLMRRSSYLSAGFALSWVFAESDGQVGSDRDE